MSYPRTQHNFHARFEAVGLVPPGWDASPLQGYPSIKFTGSIYSCFEKGCPTKPYATIPKDVMENEGSWSLFEALGVSATERETTQTNVFMTSLFLLVNTVNFNQSTPNFFYP